MFKLKHLAYRATLSSASSTPLTRLGQPNSAIPLSRKLLMAYVLVVVFFMMTCPVCGHPPRSADTLSRLDLLLSPILTVSSVLLSCSIKLILPMFLCYYTILKFLLGVCVSSCVFIVDLIKRFCCVELLSYLVWFPLLSVATNVALQITSCGASWCPVSLPLSNPGTVAIKLVPFSRLKHLVIAIAPLVLRSRFITPEHESLRFEQSVVS